MTNPAITSRPRRMNVVVKGTRVQAVGYRQFVQERAAAQPGISGYVRNMPDGDLEVVAEGPQDQLGLFLREVGQGPPGAVIDEVHIRWAEPEGTFSGFETRR